MAFRDSNTSAALVKSGQEEPPQARLVGESEPIEVVLENFGFLGLNGETKVKLFAQGYDTDSVPTSSASLFAIANKRGLFAAAAFSNLIVGSTSSLREAFTNASEKIAPYNSRPSISLPTNISHVAFTADESHLVLGSSSGGLAVYPVGDLLSAGSDSKPVFELGTNGVSLRELKPNPATPGLVAIVTSEGHVQIINIDRKGFEKSSSGDAVLKKEASTVSWSPRGKQIVCGMGDGTGWQMTSEGEVKAVLPSVPGLENHFISSIVWVETNAFITTHTPVPSGGTKNESVFHALARDRDRDGASYQYIKLPDPVPPFGMESRTPPYFFHAVIRQYAPGVKDAVIFTNTCSSDVGLVCRFSTALTGDPAVPADNWITANIGDDTRRAQMPLSDEMSDTSPVGMALDLSNKANVKRPVGGEEIEESPGPLPILMVLNHEGLLSAWNVIYNDAIERGERYSGMVVYAAQEGSSQSAPQTPQQPASQRQPVQNITPGSAFGVGSFGQSPVSNGNGTFSQSPGLGGANTFGKPATGAFGQPTASPAFGQPSSINTSGASAFGKPALGGSMWGSTSGASPSTAIPTSGTAFGQPSALGTRPAFGQPAALGGQPAFGRTAAFGVQPAFGQPAPLGSATPAPAFGAPTLLGVNKPGATGFGAVSSLGNPSVGGSPFGSASAFGGGSAFGAYANKGGFSAAAAGSGDSKSIWGTGKGLGSDGTPTAFGGGSTAPSPFGSGSTNSFKISSAFKPEPLSTSESKPSSSSGSFGGFKMGIGDALTSSPSVVSRPELLSPLPTPRGVSDQNIRDASMDDSDEQPDEPSDDDDIISPGVTKARQAGFPSTPAKPALPSGIFSNTKAADSSPFTSGPPASVNQSSSPFNSASSPSSRLPSSAWGAQLETPFGVPSTPPPKSPFGATSKLASPFGAPSRPLTFAQSPEKRPELSQSSTTAPITSSPPPPPLPPPPSFTPLEKGLETLPALPTDESPKPALSKEISSILLAPDTKSVQESDDTRAGELPSLPSSAPESVGTDNEKVASLDGSDDSDGCQESKGEDDEEGERDNEGDEDEEGGDEDDDNSEGNDALPTGGFAHEPKSKLPSTSSSPNTSNVFGADTSYKETFSGGIEENAPFSLLAKSRPPVNDSDSDQSSNSPPTSSGPRSRAYSTPTNFPATKNKEKRNSALGRGGIFNRSPKKPDTSKVLNALPPPDFLVSGNKPRGTPPFQPSVALAPGDLLPSINKPSGSSPLAAPALQVKQASQEEGEKLLEEALREEEEVQEEEEVESDLDFDNEYDDYDPDRVRNKLLNSDVKPVQELPKFRRNGEVEVASDFNAVFDSIYLSGNMMVNRLGLTAQGLKAYHLGQESPLPDVEHKAAKDMKRSQDWRFCEMGQVKEILDQLLTSARGENQGNDELEVKYQAASKGFIKLDIKDAEIKRLLAVHNDAQAAAIARARPLTPEQVLQQRKLRKEYARVERLLREAEKEVTQLKAKIASRDRDKPGAVVPPTVEAVKNTVMKLTGMVERKNGDIDYLEERLRRIKIKSRSLSVTPSKPRGLTPNRTLRGETPQRFETPEKLRSYDHDISSISYSASPVLALVDPLDVEEAREEIRARKEMGRKLRDALERCGPKLTMASK